MSAVYGWREVLDECVIVGDIAKSTPGVINDCYIWF